LAQPGSTVSQGPCNSARRKDRREVDQTKLGWLVVQLIAGKPLEWLVVSERVAAAGYDASGYSGHSLRAGFPPVRSRREYRHSRSGRKPSRGDAMLAVKSAR
jgi:hypothetical protein